VQEKERKGKRTGLSSPPLDWHSSPDGRHGGTLGSTSLTEGRLVKKRTNAPWWRLRDGIGLPQRAKEKKWRGIVWRDRQGTKKNKEDEKGEVETAQCTKRSAVELKEKGRL